MNGALLAAAEVSFATAAAGCRQRRALPLLYETPHVTVYSEGPSLIGEADWLETAVVEYIEWFGAPPDSRITVHHYSSSEEVAGNCEHAGGALPIVGCATGTEVDVNYRYFPHEMVHAVGSHVGDPPPWLREGTAEVLGGGRTRDDAAVVPDSAALVDFVEEGVFTSGSWDERRARYWRAASFVAFLLDEYGRELVVRLYAGLPRGSNRGDQNAAMMSVFGASLEELASRWAARGTVPWSSVWRPIPECETPELASGDLELLPGVRVFPYEAGVRSAIRTLTVEEPRRLSLETSAGASDEAVHLVTMMACGNPFQAYRRAFRPSPPSLTVIDVPAGHYLVVASVNDRTEEVDRTSMAHVELHTEAPDGCGGTPVALDEYESFELHPAAGATWEMCDEGCVAAYRVRSEVGARLVMEPVIPGGVDGSALSRLAVCSTCAGEDPTDCVELPPDVEEAPFEVPPGEDRWLVFEPAAGAQAFWLYVRLEPVL